jgi:hypothetical protein
MKTGLFSRKKKGKKTETRKKKNLHDSSQLVKENCMMEGATRKSSSGVFEARYGGKGGPGEKKREKEKEKKRRPKKLNVCN